MPEAERRDQFAHIVAQHWQRRRIDAVSPDSDVPVAVHQTLQQCEPLHLRRAQILARDVLVADKPEPVGGLAERRRVSRPAIFRLAKADRRRAFRRMPRTNIGGLAVGNQTLHHAIGFRNSFRRAGRHRRPVAQPDAQRIGRDPQFGIRQVERPCQRRAVIVDRQPAARHGERCRDLGRRLRGRARPRAISPALPLTITMGVRNPQMLGIADDALAGREHDLETWATHEHRTPGDDPRRQPIGIDDHVANGQGAHGREAVRRCNQRIQRQRLRALLRRQQEDLADHPLARLRIE